MCDQLTPWQGMCGYKNDATGNLITSRVKDAHGPVVAKHAYKVIRVRDHIDRSNGTYTTLSHNVDPRYLLTAIPHKNSINKTLAETTYVTHDNVGKPLSMEDRIGSWSYSYDAINRLVSAYLEGSLVARFEDSSVRYYYFDELGSTRLLTDGSGNVTDRYAYDAYGSLLSHDRFDGSVNQPYQYVGQLGYYTHWMEPDFELLQLGVRFYDPEVGRFTQKDRVYRPAVSSYAYAGDTPFRNVDPSGLTSIIVNPGAYQSCAAAACRNGGANLFSDVYTRRVKRLDKWAFVKCVAGATWSDMIKAAACVFTCRQSIVSQTAFAACFAECMAPGLGDEPTIDEIIQCYNVTIDRNAGLLKRRG